MRKLLATAIAALTITGLIVVAGPTRASVGAPCTDVTDRACLLEVAYTYIYAQAGDAPRSSMRVADEVQRWENGVNTGDGAGELKGSGSGEGMQPITARYVDDWVDVETGNVFARWMMDVKTPAGQLATAHILERVLVDDQGCGAGPSPCIQEIEAVFCIGYNGEEEAHPAPGALPNAVANFLCHRSAQR